MPFSHAVHVLNDLARLGISVPPRPVPPFESLPSKPSHRERELDVEYQEACTEWVKAVIRLHLEHFPPSS